LIIPVTVISALNLAAWMGIAYAIFEFIAKPLAVAVGIGIVIWIIFKGLALFIQLFEASRGR